MTPSFKRPPSRCCVRRQSLVLRCALLTPALQATSPWRGCGRPLAGRSLFAPDSLFSADADALAALTHSSGALSHVPARGSAAPGRVQLGVFDAPSAAPRTAGRLCAPLGPPTGQDGAPSPSQLALSLTCLQLWSESDASPVSEAARFFSFVCGSVVGAWRMLLALFWSHPWALGGCFSPFDEVDDVVSPARKWRSVATLFVAQFASSRDFGIAAERVVEQE